MRRPLLYKLVDREAVPCNDYVDWAMKADSRRVALEELVLGEEPISISTVFLGVDHAVNGPPMVFETLVYGGALDRTVERYSTWDEAIAGHDEMVAWVRALGKPHTL